MEYQITGQGYFAIARRNDRLWGNSIRVGVFGSNREYLGRLHFACHPEFDDFDRCQQMTTDELLAVVATRLPAGMEQNSFTDAWDGGLSFMLHLNSPDDERPHIGAR